MAITAALTHRTTYSYEPKAHLGPQIVRLRPAPHCRTPILSFSQRITPKKHFINWQQDPFGNYLARLVFEEPTDKFEVIIDLAAKMDAINPFDFFLTEDAEEVPFSYDRELSVDLKPYLVDPIGGPRFKDFLESIDRTPMSTNDFLVMVNRQVRDAVGYVIRLEPGVQTPEETLAKGSGSCRDSAWLLVNLLRGLGYAARFCSGYLIQLAPDEPEPGEKEVTAKDFCDLHAWAEVYAPGAGWIGLDATSGLLAGEGHIPLAATPNPRSAAPVTGALSECEVQLDFHMDVARIHETPRVTAPIDDLQWRSVDTTGRAIDKMLKDGDVRLTMGGEPTFIAADDLDAEEWNIEAVGPTKRAYADTLIRRLRREFAPGGVIHHGQGKWYPGEPLPRWAFSVYWRADGQPLWSDPSLIADEEPQETPASADDAQSFTAELCAALELDERCALPLFEDTAEFLKAEAELPVDVDPRDNKLEDPEERARMARVFDRGLTTPAAFVIPVQAAQNRHDPGRRVYRWLSEIWHSRRKALFLKPGDSPAGFRLPLNSLSYVPPEYLPAVNPMDPFTPRHDLPARTPRLQQRGAIEDRDQNGVRRAPQPADPPVRTALVVEPRDGVLHVFLPPTNSADEFVDLIQAVEETAVALKMPVRIEGYEPPRDWRVQVLKVTPDPGVIEVNVQPVADWDGQKDVTETLYDQAKETGLIASRFHVDGRPTGSGGGNHIVVGGATPADSPFLRRPDLLASLIRYWQNHPSLSYLFSGQFIGPTSQAPRIDEARHESLYELDIALGQVPHPDSGAHVPPWLVDRLFRHLLVDVTGNTHRSEICIDKLYSPDGPTGRLGLVEFRAFEMPPHPRMALAQNLLLRALIARFWNQPYVAPLQRFGTGLHDRFMLPDVVWSDFCEVLRETSDALGVRLERDWYKAQFEFRFPFLGAVRHGGVDVEIRAGLEPWHVLGEEGMASGTARFVDSSLDRVQVKVQNEDPSRHVVTCQTFEAPLQDSPLGDGRVAGVRYRTWMPPSCLHPTIWPHDPLVFDVADKWSGRSLGGCTLSASHPGGRNMETRPVNALEAEGRRLARFAPIGHTPGPFSPRSPAPNPEYPWTLDLRRAA